MAVNSEVTCSSSKRARRSNTPPVTLSGDEESTVESHYFGAAQKDPEEAYYCANFKKILQFVLQESMDAHVISEAALQTVQSFLQLSGNAQLLFMRLFLRKHRWLRTAKLSYPDIAPCLVSLLTTLVQENLLLDEGSITELRDGLMLLQMAELKMLCKEFTLPSSLVSKPKPLLIDGIIKYCKQCKPLFGKGDLQKTAMKRVKVLLGGCVKVCPAVADSLSQIVLIYSLYTTGFSLDEESERQRIVYRMLEVSIGRIVYPSYQVYVTRPLFTSQDEFARFYEAIKTEQRLSALLEVKDVNKAEVSSIAEWASSVLSAELMRVGLAKAESQSDIQEPIMHQLRSRTITASSLSPDKCTCDTLLDPFLVRYSVGWVCARILSHCVDAMEWVKDYDRACELLAVLVGQRVFCSSLRGHWWERLTLDLDHHLHRQDRCLEVIKQALSDPELHDSRKLSLVQRAHRICQNAANRKRRKQKIAFRIEDFRPLELTPHNEITLTGHLQPQSCSFRVQTQSSVALLPVEDFAIHHYTTEGGWSKALHAEGATFALLFILLMWETVYCSHVPDVFRGPYQSMPLDFGSKMFYSNRQQVIDSRLEWIRQATAEELSTAVEVVWHDHCGEECPGVNWDLFPDQCEDAKSLTECMGGDLLANICGILSRDYRGNRGGLPDLTLWNPSSRQCKFVEVKGPTDRLSHTQTVWLSRLACWGCSVEVCWVKAIKD